MTAAMVPLFVTVTASTTDGDDVRLSRMPRAPGPTIPTAPRDVAATETFSSSDRRDRFTRFPAWVSSDFMVVSFETTLVASGDIITGVVVVLGVIAGIRGPWPVFAGFMQPDINKKTIIIAITVRSRSALITVIFVVSGQNFIASRW
jgi:hypothetical protein